MVKSPIFIAAPSYQQACDIIDNETLSYWLPFLKDLQAQYKLGTGQWLQIREGSNALFELNDTYVVKIVPPNWHKQGLAEIASNEFLPDDLSLTTPVIYAHGAINEWVYLVMSKLKGKCLAHVWPHLTVDEKKPIIKRLGSFMHELHQIPLTKSEILETDWAGYIKNLIDTCMQRHTRKQVPELLLQQIMSFIEQYYLAFSENNYQFIHMDLHPWNLMVQKVEGVWHLSGVLDFGDAIYGQNRLFELLTPCCFMAQGNSELYKELLAGYQLITVEQADQMQFSLMATALIRPASDINFVMQQAPITAPINSWEQVAQQLFPKILGAD